MKNISFALTTLQAYAQCKTVTRRFGCMKPRCSWSCFPGKLVHHDP
jgi:hypothetical protein